MLRRLRRLLATFGKWLVTRYEPRSVVVDRLQFVRMTNIQSWLEKFIDRHYVEGGGECVYVRRQILEYVYERGFAVGERLDGESRVRRYGMSRVSVRADEVEKDPEKLIASWRMLKASFDAYRRSARIADRTDPKVRVELTFTRED